MICACASREPVLQSRAMLRVGQLIPAVTARTADGCTVQAWDFKQKKSLAIAFLHAECARCEEWMGWLAREAGELAERDAVALVILPATPLSTWAQQAAPLQGAIVLAADVSGRSQRAFLGGAVTDRHRPASLGVFVTDRYGELSAQWLTESEDGLPSMRDVLTRLGQIQAACEECGGPQWVE